MLGPPPIFFDPISFPRYGGMEAPEEDAEQAREILKEQINAAREVPVVFSTVEID